MKMIFKSAVFTVKSKFNFFIFSQFLLLNFGFAAFADQSPVGVPDYGQIYVVERSLHEVKSWRTSLSYGFEFGNSYQDVHHVKLSVERSMGRYAWIGIQSSLYRGFASGLFRALHSQVQARDLVLEGHAPLYSVYPVLTWSPVGGHLSFLRDQPIEAELGLQLGAGYVKYAGASGRLGVLWAIRPVVHLSPTLSLLGSFGHDAESVFKRDDRIVHMRGELGVAYQF